MSVLRLANKSSIRRRPDNSASRCMNRHQVAVAAEAHAAAVFAQAGYSVFVQYGANQPGYDLAVSNDKKTVLVSVKGSSNGGWMLTTKKPEGTYRSALEAWEAKNASFVFFYVQYQGVKVGELPRMYIALGREVAKHQYTGLWGGIALSLIEDQTITRGPKKGKTQSVPSAWRVTEERVHEVFSLSSA